jgi:hypothetical protein
MQSFSGNQPRGGGVSVSEAIYIFGILDSPDSIFT